MTSWFKHKRDQYLWHDLIQTLEWNQNLVHPTDAAFDYDVFSPSCSFSLEREGHNKKAQMYKEYITLSFVSAFANSLQ